MQLWTESGLSKAAYADQCGINRNTFYGWVNRHGTKPSGLVAIHHLKPVETGKPLHFPVELRRPNGYRISIPSAFNQESLSLLLDILEDRKCS
jgi:transposase-like protein